MVVLQIVVERCGSYEVAESSKNTIAEEGSECLVYRCLFWKGVLCVNNWEDSDRFVLNWVAEKVLLVNTNTHVVRS